MVLLLALIKDGAGNILYFVIANKYHEKHETNSVLFHLSILSDFPILCGSAPSSLAPTVGLNLGQKCIYT